MLNKKAGAVIGSAFFFEMALSRNALRLIAGYFPDEVTPAVLCWHIYWYFENPGA
jgi:hypothetical protein